MKLTIVNNSLVLFSDITAEEQRALKHGLTCLQVGDTLYATLEQANTYPFNATIKELLQESVQYMLGQRIIYESVICTVVAPPKGRRPSNTTIWIFNPGKGYVHYIAKHNAKPLPGGQL